MLNKYIIGELFEIVQDYKGGSLEFKTVGSKSNSIELCIGNKKLMILCTSGRTYSIIVKDDVYTHLGSLTRNQALELLCFLKEIYDNCKEYPNAFHNALEQMRYKYEREKELK